MDKVFLENSFSTMKCAEIPLYIAPEIVLQESTSFSCDIFSLGVISYELTSRKLPFNKKALKDYDQSIRNGPSSLPSSISPEFSHLIFQMLQRNPENIQTLTEIRFHLLIQLENYHETTHILKTSSTKSLLPFVKKYRRDYSKLDFCIHSENLQNNEHWIFVSPDFDFSSFKLKSDLNETIFFTLEKSGTTIS